MRDILVKVRNEEKVLRHVIPDYIEESEHFNFVDYIDTVIINSGLPLENTIVYDINQDGTITCLGIDDGFEIRNNESVARRKKNQKLPVQ
jgi:hypothetical protein